MTTKSLNVIALVSGGKDSFFSILHCLANGHRVVALANLHPPDASSPTGATAAAAQSSHDGTSGRQQENVEGEEVDLNSFMYQTVGHSVVPLYAAATGLPLYRQPIVGGAVHHGVSYDYRAPNATGFHEDRDTVVDDSARLQHADERDETESLVPLLQTVMKAHPDANALCTGAILSTYQRTRVESVALRLGLVPLAYLWQFPALPVPSSSSSSSTRKSRQHPHNGAEQDDAQLLCDMEAAGLDARIVKVASAGLDEGFLWENVATASTVQRVRRALRRFGGGGRGAVLGEGGEFETLVVDGPVALFRRGRIVVPREGRGRVVREGGGCAWLGVRGAFVEMRNGGEETVVDGAGAGVRVPGLFDARFEAVLEALGRWGDGGGGDDGGHVSADGSDRTKGVLLSESRRLSRCLEHSVPYPSSSTSPSSQEEWCFRGNGEEGKDVDISAQTTRLVSDIRQRLHAQSLPATAITGAVIVLRHMSDFPTVNQIYGALFQEPNPPARVTIACGDCMMPRQCGIAVFLTVQPYSRPLIMAAAADDSSSRRQGLHVQSRSYWAPANIGPYSQAIAVPLVGAEALPPLDDGDNDTEGHNDDYSQLSSPKAVTIAGQIPLVPATMALPLSPSQQDAPGDSPSSLPTSTSLQITLALQHLWRVGVEMQVQWWTSAVAYFPRTPSPQHMKQKTHLAAQAWRTAHIWPLSDDANNTDADQEEDNDEDNDGPDLWDRRHNPQYMTLVDDAEALPRPLPDWDVLSPSSLNHHRDSDNDNEEQATTQIKRALIPPFFAAEVDELPRAAGVEWHAHVGLAQLIPGCVTLVRQDAVNGSLNLYHTVVETSGAVFLHTVASVVAGGGEVPRLGDVLSDVCGHVRRALGRGDDEQRPYLSYVDSGRVSGDGGGIDEQAVIPCRSLWGDGGERLLVVSLFRFRFARNGRRGKAGEFVK